MPTCSFTFNFSFMKTISFSAPKHMFSSISTQYNCLDCRKSCILFSVSAILATELIPDLKRQHNLTVLIVSFMSRFINKMHYNSVKERISVSCMLFNYTTVHKCTTVHTFSNEALIQLTRNRCCYILLRVTGK